MYGYNNFDDEQLQQPFPQFVQGLLGEQNNRLQNLIDDGTNAAEQLGQFAQVADFSGNDSIAQRQAASQQAAQQAIASQQQQQAASGALLGKIASLFVPGGSILGYIKKKI